MRDLMLSDLVSAARVLRAAPGRDRNALCQRLITQAHYADVFYKKLGYPHPRWGNGALGAAARGHATPRGHDLSDPEFCDCLSVVLAGISAFRKGDWSAQQRDISRV
ncbi:hypothetical protein [uncultured Roseobacter sp.]|uniref:DUF7742 family protein n=1 Tax=uncultured Roseobacter sp. TaxID=114847 RepID=UPI0026273A0D|nr:hypothetical protein [uncultured Roseobacter sp.]